LEPNHRHGHKYPLEPNHQVLKLQDLMYFVMLRQIFTSTAARIFWVEGDDGIRPDIW
jgi:hypothetical protein